MADIEVLFHSDDDMNVGFDNSEDLGITFDSTEDTDADMGEVNVVVTSDHRELRHRDAENQHPISSITGLQDALDNMNAQISNHVDNSEIHITQEERTNWNNKSRVYRNASGALVLSV